jgi:hypothetical protein
MGAGDNLMASGMARGAAKRCKRIAFGDGRNIKWDHHSKEIFRGNPNVAPPGTERTGGIEWIPFYKGHRIYNRGGADRWIWNYDFRAVAGEVFFSDEEIKFAERFGGGFVVVEPNVPAFKGCAPNKQWPVERYDAVALELKRAGHDVVQFVYGPGHGVRDVRRVPTQSFRHGIAMLSRAALYIGPEGGLHHGAAAVGIPAVVLFGGFVPPQVTGYESHTNLTGGVEACGSFNACQHCRAALDAISVDEVLSAAHARLDKVAA